MDAVADSLMAGSTPRKSDRSVTKNRTPVTVTLPIDSNPATPEPALPRVLAHAGLILALIGSGTLVDTAADESFIAIQRISLFFGTLLLGCAGFVWKHAGTSRVTQGNPARWPVWGLAATLAWILIGSWQVVDPRLIGDWFAMATLAAAAAVMVPKLVPLKRAWLITMTAVAINVVLSLLQHFVAELQLSTIQLGGRLATTALLGNEGYVAMAAALGGGAAIALALRGNATHHRLVGGVFFLVCLVSIVANRQITAALGLATSVVFVLLVRIGWRPVRIGATLALLGLASIVTLGTLKAPAPDLDRAERIQHWNYVSTYRLGPMAAAVEMIEDAPIFGHGLGSFAEQAQVRRIEAEQRWRSALPMPPNAQAFVHVHQDYLQLAAEAGIPALLLALIALGWSVVNLLTIALRTQAAEPLALLGLLASGSVMSLAWFPMHIPLTQALLAIATGRAIAVLAASAPEPLPTRSIRWVFALPVVALGLSTALELRAYPAERALAGLGLGIDQVLTGQIRGDNAIAAITTIRDRALAAHAVLPEDPRPVLFGSIALILNREIPAAKALLLDGLSHNERPELLVQYARAVAATGDETRARHCLLRAAWAAHAALETVPRTTRDEIRADVARRRERLAQGDLDAVPPIDTCLPDR